MKPYYLLFIICILASCKTKPAGVIIPVNKIKSVKVSPASYKTGSTISASGTDTSDNIEQLDAFATYYVLVADTGTNYEALRGKMFDLHQSSKLIIDTMGRFYDKAKDLIKLPDNDEDEIFAGDYFQRRNVSETLSLEYLNTYQAASLKKTIALVAGIYETKASADSALNAIKPSEKAFVLKSRIYVGCMH